MSHAGAPLWGDNRYGSGKPSQQIALWGYKLSFEHPTKHEIMTLHDLPHGSVWSEFGIQNAEFGIISQSPEATNT